MNPTDKRAKYQGQKVSQEEALKELGEPKTWPGEALDVAQEFNRPRQSTWTVCLVGCGGQKLDHAAPARDLYTGPLFRSSLRCAMRPLGFEFDRVYIASAKHGLVELDQVLEPYDQRLQSYVKDTPAGREALVWARGILEQLNLRRPAGSLYGNITLFAGSAYRDPIMAVLEEQLERYPRWSGYAPLQGCRGIGDMRGWLGRHTKR
jgi:hypothetical protein